GSAVAGVCLIRLAHLRPNWLHARIGWGAENAAHRIAVEWDGPAGIQTGVYIPQRHSSSRLAVLAGGRVFPGEHKLAKFSGEETPSQIQVSLDAIDVHVHADVAVRQTLRSTLFSDLEEASAFFRKDAVGWSPARNGSLEGLRLDTNYWAVDAGEALSVESSYFDALPAGSAVLDCVLVMRDVPVIWSVPSEGVPEARVGVARA
ncbi:MAG: hypothetical protein ABL886_14380, partial [Rhodoglobus sp.]